MKYIIIALALITIGCGPHFNRFAQPDIYVEPAPKVAVDVPVQQPDTMTINLPNWPVFGYSVEGAIIILLVKDPKTFPIPGAFTFQAKDGSVITMPMVKPDKEKPK